MNTTAMHPSAVSAKCFPPPRGPHVLQLPDVSEQRLLDRTHGGRPGTAALWPERTGVRRSGRKPARLRRGRRREQGDTHHAALLLETDQRAAVAELSHVPQLQIVLRNCAGRRLLAGTVLEVQWEVVLQRLVQESVVRAGVVQKPAEGPAESGRAYPSTVGGVCLRSGVVADRVVFVQHAGKNAGVAEVSRDGRGGGRPVWLLVFRV